MSRPPLANLFAAYDEDPARLEELARDLVSRGGYEMVWRPVAGWVCAAAPLPGSAPDAEPLRARGFAFAEGRDRLFASGGDGPNAIELAARLTDEAPERLASLPGDFGFIRFGRSGEATVVRSCGGLVPFYLWRSRARAAIATRLGEFVRYLPDEPRLDPLVNAVWASGRCFFPDRRTFLADVSILERGHYARFPRDGTVVVERYWNPRPSRLARPTPAVASEHAERLRAIVLARLKEDLDSEGGNLLTLSGGVDSSSLAALAAGTLGLKLSIWSLLPSPEDLFQHEMSYIEPLASRFGFERRWSLRLRAETRVELLRGAPRVVFHVMHPALCALPSVQREAPVRVLFGGEFADEVCGSGITWADWADHTGPLRLLAGVRELPFGPRDIFRWARHRLHSARGRLAFALPEQLPDVVRREVQEEYAAWRVRRRALASRDSAPLRHLTLRADEDGFVAMNWEATSALGIRRSFPFFNRDALELAYQCHPSELLGPGTKRLLRRAFRDDVPSRNLERTDKGHWGGYLRGSQLPWQSPLAEALACVVRPDWHPQPPAHMDRGEAGGLCQLAVFVESIQHRRDQRRERQAHLR